MALSILTARMHKMYTSNRRKHDRLALRLDVTCRKIGAEEKHVAAGRTRNISTGGVLFEVGHCPFACDDLLSMELAVPPAEGILNFGGRLTTFARIVRIEPDMARQRQENYAVAAEFTHSPKLSI
jgi:hypothetical protein